MRTIFILFSLLLLLLFFVTTECPRQKHVSISTEAMFSFINSVLLNFYFQINVLMTVLKLLKRQEFTKF